MGCRLPEHAFTAYLFSDGRLEHAQRIACHESARTTKLYDRTGDAISPDEIERTLGRTVEKQTNPHPVDLRPVHDFILIGGKERSPKWLRQEDPDVVETVVRLGEGDGPIPDAMTLLTWVKSLPC